MPTRQIKASINQSLTLADLSAGAERLFYRLLVEADDHGVVRIEPRIVKGRCLPLIDCSAADVGRWIGELQEVGLICRYVAGQKTFAQFVSFGEHNRAPRSDPRNPLPADGVVLETLPADDGQCRTMPDNARQSQLERVESREYRVESTLPASAGKAQPSPKKLPEEHPAWAVARAFETDQRRAGVTTNGTLDSWAKCLDQIHRIDSVEWRIIAAVLEWVPTDNTGASARGDWPGWGPNVRSLAGLRQVKGGESKWSKLLAAYQQAQCKPSHHQAEERLLV